MMEWKGFCKPKRLEFEKETLSKNYGKFFAEPFERGFGLTIGNSLRRVLLSSLQGAAVTSVKFGEVLHEFSSMPGVVEDTTEIILNLKGLLLNLHSKETKKIYIKAEGEREVKASDIIADPTVEILNPDLHIATLSQDGKLEMEMEVRSGRGYVPAEKNKEEGQPIGVIPIDAIFSPIKKVDFHVENARVGQATDYDKLILEIWTNGSVEPENAIAYAAKILKDHLTIFINFEEEPEMEVAGVDETKEKMRQNLMRSVNELELSVRSYNCLKNAEIKAIIDLVRKTDVEMLKTKNFGRKSLNEIKEILSEMGLTLGMNVDEYFHSEKEE